MLYNGVHTDDEYDLDPESTVSTTECTGMVQTPPISDAEAESYEDIYSIPIQGKLNV